MKEDAMKEDAMKREFILAISIFVTMAVVGTLFGLWFVSRYAPTPSAPVVTPAR